LVPALALLLTATVVSGTIALRAPWGEYAVIPPVAMFLTGIVFGPARAEAPVLLGIGMLVVSVGWISSWRWRRRRRLARARDAASAARLGRETRTLVAAVLVFAFAAGGSVVTASTLVPGGDRAVLRNA